MPDDAVDRIRADLAVMQKAMAIRPEFGNGMVLFDILFSAIAVVATIASLQMENDWRQVLPLVAILCIVPIGLYSRLLLGTHSTHEINFQVLISAVIYAVVWIAACGYSLAAICRESIGELRTAGLIAASIGILLIFTAMLIRTGMLNRERQYSFGLGVSTILAGTLLPVVNSTYVYPVAHSIMAAGLLTVASIQWAQLRDSAVNHATHH
jgi:hypothetical protein